MDYKFGVTPEEETRVTPKIFPLVGHLSTEGKNAFCPLIIGRFLKKNDMQGYWC